MEEEFKEGRKGEKRSITGTIETEVGRVCRKQQRDEGKGRGIPRKTGSGVK